MQLLTYLSITHQISTTSPQPPPKSWVRVLRLCLTSLLLALIVIPPNQSGLAQSCNSSPGVITRSHFRSETAETTFYYSVYTPPCYDTSTNAYPVVYLMHGSNDD